MVCELPLAVIGGCGEGACLKCSYDYLSGTSRVSSILILQGDIWDPQRTGEGVEDWVHPALTGTVLFSMGHCDYFLSYSLCLPPPDYRTFLVFGGNLRLEGHKN